MIKMIDFFTFFRYTINCVYERRRAMRITMATTPQEVATKTKTVMNREVIPNMLLKNVGKPNGFISKTKDYEFWLHRVCGRHE